MAFNQFQDTSNVATEAANYYLGIALPGIICGLISPFAIGLEKYLDALGLYVGSRHDLLYEGLLMPIWCMCTLDGATDGKDMTIFSYQCASISCIFNYGLRGTTVF